MLGWVLNLDFAGGGVVPSVTPKGGGRGAKGRKVRRFVVDGKVYTARTRREEMDLARQLLAQAERTIQEQPASRGAKISLAKARARVAKIEAEAAIKKKRDEEDVLWLLLMT